MFAITIVLGRKQLVVPSALQTLLRRRWPGASFDITHDPTRRNDSIDLRTDRSDVDVPHEIAEIKREVAAFRAASKPL